MFGQFAAQQADGQGGGVDRGKAELLNQKRNRADMILVAVGQEQAADIVGPFFQYADVRQHQVDAMHVRFGEHQAAIDQQDRAAMLNGHHVQAYFAQAAERQEADFIICDGRQALARHPGSPG